MGYTRYTKINGETVKENRNSLIHDYVPDALGNTVALLGANQAITDTWTYWPYGETNRVTGTTAADQLYNGASGYVSDAFTKRIYVRARYLDTAKARWVTRTIGACASGGMSPYRYRGNQPMQPGLDAGAGTAWATAVGARPSPCFRACRQPTSTRYKCLQCCGKCATAWEQQCGALYTLCETLGGGEKLCGSLVAACIKLGSTMIRDCLRYCHLKPPPAQGGA